MEIMGLDEDEYLEMYFFSNEEKLLFLEKQKKLYGWSILLSCFPVTSIFGLHFYINGDWIRGLITNVIYFGSTAIFFAALTKYEERNPGLVYGYANTCVVIFSLWYLYGIFYSIFEIDWYNSNIDTTIERLTNHYNDIHQPSYLSSFIFSILPQTDGALLSFGMRF